MEAKELRIGNWLLNTNNEYEQVYDIGHDVNEWDISVLYPIPLTEEILLKCGFKYLNGRTSGDLTFDVLHYEFDYIDGVFVTKSRYEPFECREKLYNFKYLHQLQNLYFALTGKELDIDLSR